jgi:hypothetical protein
MGVRRVCPQCASAEVQRLPENGIAPHPGYECTGCGLAMRPNGSGLAFAAILILAVVMCVAGVLPWFGIPKDVDRLPLGLPVVAAGVALYSLYQLLRPAPRLTDEDSGTRRLTPCLAPSGAGLRCIREGAWAADREAAEPLSWLTDLGRNDAP